MDKVKINTDYIKLGQLLKLCDIAQTGGQAKFLILDGNVRVNGKIVTERGKKIYPGDIVEVDNIGEIEVTR